MAQLFCKFCGQKIRTRVWSPEEGKWVYDHGALMLHVMDAHEDHPEVLKIQEWAAASSGDEEVDRWAVQQGLIPSSVQDDW